MARFRNFHFRAFGTETFSIYVNLTGMGPHEARQVMEPSELFLAAAVAGTAVLIEIGAFIVFGMI